MDKFLKRMFDFQKFESNSKLKKLIDDTNNRYSSQLSDDDLSLVCAAGDIDNHIKNRQTPDEII